MEPRGHRIGDAFLVRVACDRSVVTRVAAGYGSDGDETGMGDHAQGGDTEVRRSNGLGADELM